MNRNTALPDAPVEYTREWMNRYSRQIQKFFNQIIFGAPLYAKTDRSGTKVISALTLADLPTSATGLPSGSVWNDAGTLKIVS